MGGFGEEPTDIRISAFFVSDHAEAVGGKLYVVGGCWDTLYVGSLPSQHPHLSVAVALHVPWPSTGRSHGIEVKLIDEDAQPVIAPMNASFEASRSPEMRPDDESTVVLVFNILNLPIQRPGGYWFTFAVDGVELARTRFRVVQRSAGSSP